MFYSFELIFWIQVLLLTIYGLFKLIQMLVRDRPKVSYGFRNFVDRVIYQFELRILFTMFLLFTIPTTTFSIYNVFFPSFSSFSFVFSFFLALFYLGLIAILIIMTLTVLFKYAQNILFEQPELDHYYKFIVYSY